MNICYADTGAAADATRLVRTTGTIDSVIQLAAPSDATLGLLEAGVSFDGVTAGNPKVLFEVLRYATPLTSGSTDWSAVTEVNCNGNDGATPRGVVIQADSTVSTANPADPGGPIVIHREWVHPQAGAVWRPSGIKVKEATAISIRLSCASSQPHYLSWFYWLE